jgi:hypothetical protein
LERTKLAGKLAEKISCSSKERGGRSASQ